MAITGYVNEILGDDRDWDASNSLEQTLASWPLDYELANFALLNGTTDRTVTVNTLNVRPYSGPQGLFPMITTERITALSDGEDIIPMPMDSANAALPATVLLKYRSTGVTVTANTIHRRDWVNTGYNQTRATQVSRLFGQSSKGLDLSESSVYRDSDMQKLVMREGEGVSLRFNQDSGPNVFMATMYIKNQSSGATYLVQKMVEPLFMDGAPVLSVFNGAGSGVILEMVRVQLREIGDDQIPLIEFMFIDNCSGMSENANVTWADSSVAIPTGVMIKKHAPVRRFGSRFGGTVLQTKFRRILGGESPYGPNTIGGHIARRGLFSHDYRNKETASSITLKPGMGVALVSRNPSAQMYSELVCNFSVNDAPSGGGGVYPATTDVRTAISYGPTGADYTGNVTLPVNSNVRVAISYGSNGTEATGNIALPAVGDVRSGISYGSNGTEATGNIALPIVTDVRVAISYGSSGTEATGNIALPGVGDVRLGTSYGANGTEATGTLVVGGGGGGGNRIFFPAGISGRG